MVLGFVKTLSRFKIREKLNFTSCCVHRAFSRSESRIGTIGTMPPIKISDSVAIIDKYVAENPVMIFSKSYCPFCSRVKGLFSDLSVKYTALELDSMESDQGTNIQTALKDKTGQGTVPSVFINGSFIGGCTETMNMHNQNKLIPLIAMRESSSSQGQGEYQYDLIVIGGGSGGLAASKEAAKLGKKVAVCDFVKPTPIGTQWGLGGTCVNVGCIPKKLMHQAALLGTAMSDAESYGWNSSNQTAHSWERMVENIQSHIKSLNWGYRVALRDAKVTYLNEFAELQDAHTLKCRNKKNKESIITGDNILVAVGGRPRYPDIPGAKEFGITSDDIFSLPFHPGKTLCIGASYISLECAGFLAGVGVEVSVMVRSILLRGFDQQLANLIGGYMEKHGVKLFKKWIPTSITKIADGTPPTLLVKAKEADGDSTMELEVNTVLFAIGRDPCTEALNLNSAGVQLSKTGKIVTDEKDCSNVNNIFAIGDVAEGRPELTPVAIQAGVLLARRLFGGSSVFTDYDKIPTTVFTPLEYGCVGLSEEAAVAKFGENNVEVYHTHFQPLECVVPKRDDNESYCKLVCLKSENDRVVGFHYLGPNAGEVTQGFALGVKLGATKSDFDSLIGIHPTNAETFTTLRVTKSSGQSALKTSC